MLRYPWRIGLALGLLIFTIVIALAATVISQDNRVPQAQPFTVYETPSACIYVVGAAPPAIAVLPSPHQRGRC